MFLGILRFEWRYHTRQLAFAVIALALSLISLTLVGTGYGPGAVDVNSPYVVMQSLGLLSLAAVFVLTVFCANAALRDVEHAMTEIVFATPVGKPRYLLGRFGELPAIAPLGAGEQRLEVRTRPAPRLGSDEVRREPRMPRIQLARPARHGLG